MIKKFRTLCSLEIEKPLDTVVLTVKDTSVSEENGGKYKISFDEHRRGEFSFNLHEACEYYSVDLGRFDADFICIGRYLVWCFNGACMIMLM